MVTRDEARGYALLLAALSQGRGLRFAKSGQRKALPYWSLLEPRLVQYHPQAGLSLFHGPLWLDLGWEPPVSMVAVMPGWGLSVGLC